MIRTPGRGLAWSWVGKALKTAVAERAVKRLDRPGTASRLTRATGMPAFRAAATAGPLTNPPVAIIAAAWVCSISSRVLDRPRRKLRQKRKPPRGRRLSGEAGSGV